MENDDRYITALVDLDEKKVLELTKERLETGGPTKILEDIKKGMDLVGKRFEEGRYFIADLMMAGAILKKLSGITKSKIKDSEKPRTLAKVVIGTVEGDFHDIGKDIVISVLETSDFEVIDLGVDVPPDKFVEAIKEYHPQIVAMSALLTIVFDSMKKTIEAIEKAGFRDKVKIMIGGGVVDDDVKGYVRADAYRSDPVAALSLARKWVQVE